MRAFTLIEVLISIVIFGLLIVSIYSVLNVGSNTYYTETGLSSLQQEARRALEWMTRELRESTSRTISVIDANNDRITFNTITASNIQYYRDRNDINGDGVTNQVIREYPAGIRKILANDITKLKFSESSNFLEIQLEAGKTSMRRELSFPLKGKVNLRNE